MTPALHQAILAAWDLNGKRLDRVARTMQARYADERYWLAQGPPDDVDEFFSSGGSVGYGASAGRAY